MFGGRASTAGGQTVTARGHVVNATGVWAAETEPALTVTPSRGTHLVVRAESMGDPRAVLTVPVPEHFGRFVFAMPQSDGLVFIGLTDEPAPGVDGIRPPVPAEDETFLRDTINRALASPLRPEDVVGRFAGLRPLVRSTGGVADGPTSDVSRKHLLIDEPDRPITIAGGKLTTYRRMAEDAVDAVCRRLERSTPPCRTQHLPLVGAASPVALRRSDAPAHLVRRYGSEASAVWSLREVDPQLADPVVPGRRTLGVELLWGALAEGALTVEDLVERRTRLSLVDGDAEAAGPTAQRALELAADPRLLGS